MGTAALWTELNRLALTFALALGAAPTGFFLTVFWTTLTGRFFAVDGLFCAQASVGNTEVNTKASPKKAAAKPLTAEPFALGEKEKPDRIGDIVFLSIA
jgi:hypothetical protein